MNFFFTTILTVVLSVGLISQTTHRNCGTMHAYQQLLNEHPEYAIERQKIEQHTQQYAVSYDAQRKVVVVTIPVVFHVVYKTTEQNVSDQMILDQLDVLNKDYRKTNADVSILPSAFSGLATDCEIQFCLAKRDPSGNATTGINRKLTTVTSFIHDDKVKFASSGGVDAWDRDKYLNIWVCNLGDDLLGYAQFPGLAANTDGVVILYSSLPGGSAAPYNQGRTATHEVGHWLNLYHIWGDDGSGCTGSDLVSDTPNQADASSGCPTFPQVSCSNGPNGDLFYNYMDYSNDACLVMFTTGQKTRMQALFGGGGTRVALLSSNGCVAPGVVCSTPSGILVNPSITTAVVSWSSVSAANSYNIRYQISGGSIQTVNTASTSVTLTGLTASSSYTVAVQAVCGATTSDYSANTSFQTLAVPCSDSYEPNEFRVKAKVVAVNTDVKANMGSSIDRDWFAFTNTPNQKNIQITLTNLPNDYNIYLYNAEGVLLLNSTNSGLTNETINYNTSVVGIYYIRVTGRTGYFNSTSCYTLRANISASSFRELAENRVGFEDLVSEFNVFPNPNNGDFTVTFNSDNNYQAFLKVYDLTGREVYAKTLDVDEYTNQTNIQLDNLETGVYLIELSDGNTRSVKKVMISK